MGALRWPAEWERTSRGVYAPRRRLRVWSPPRCAIGVNSSVSRGDVASTTATTTITKPAGTAADDVLVVVFGNDRSSSGSAPITTAPTGWTAIFTQFETADAVPNHVRLHGFWALGSVSNLGFTNSASTAQQGWACVGFTGVDNTTPIDAVDNGGTNHSTGSASLSVGAVTVATDGAWHLIAFAAWNGGTNSATGFTVVQNVATPPAASADGTLLYNSTHKSPGSTGTVTVSSSASATGQILAAAPFALRPQGPPRTRLYIRETFRPGPFRPGFGR